MSRLTDQPWFGYRCRLAADRKYSAWLNYKRNPTHRNKTLHPEVCRNMRATSKWTQRRWENYLRSKLCGPGAGSKTWWSLVKERQGTRHQETIPSLTRQDDTTATSSKEKADLLVDIFSTKMTVVDPNRPPLQLAQECDQVITMVEVTQERVEQLLRAVDIRKTSRPDDVSPQVLRNCSSELAGFITEVFTSCAQENTWPSIWKEARVVPVHKRKSKINPSNYRPISLLSVVGKSLLSNHQLGFRSGSSISDLLMFLSRDW